MKDNSILIKSLSKQFKMGATQVRALDDATLELQKGQMTALRGPSGCGKKAPCADGIYIRIRERAGEARE
ncbi:MAG: hypothetical protein LBU32_17920 [Clostridiales bacterium]|nr:hypothetical protein [Clostridiales bacterium]